MKLIPSVLSLIALAFAIPLLAQEESASPASEETPSTSIEETAAPTAPPTPEKTAPANATASATATAAPRAAEKKPTAAAETKPSAATAASAIPAGKKMNVQAAVKDSENRWAVALGKHDAAAVEAMVAADFIGVNPKGKVQNRRAMLAEMKGDKDTYTSNKNEKLDVRMYGPGLAVAVGTYREKGTGKDGKTFDRTYRFTDTWMDRGGHWQCIASHLALLAQK